MPKTHLAFLPGGASALAIACLMSADASPDGVVTAPKDNAGASASMIGAPGDSQKGAAANSGGRWLSPAHVAARA